MLKCKYYPKWSQSQCDPYQNPNDFFSDIEKSIPIIHMDSQGTLNSQNNSEKEEQSCRICTSLFQNLL